MRVALTTAGLVLVAVVAASPLAGEPPAIDWQVVSRRPHDGEAWTQGLLLDPQGRLFESTGLLGRSTLREVDARSGAVLRQVALADDLFGEGLALVDGVLIQLTWTSGVAIAWDARTLEPIERFEYAGEGWGLCFDGERLVMSDGSATLTFRDAGTFEVSGRVEIKAAGDLVMRFNELECQGGDVWANLYPTDRIARIDPVAGRVTGLLDLSPIVEAAQRSGDASILNGIAYDAASDTYLVTGKLWSEVYELRLLDDQHAGPTEVRPTHRPGARSPAWDVMDDRWRYASLHADASATGHP